MSNIFRDPMTGELDRQFLRNSAVWRLIKAGRVTSKAHAIRLLAERGNKVARGTVEVWMTSHSMRHVTLKP